ncbi:DUF488 domain-containing protein [Devosia faecipullorum]|uniref:DUF488 domain-containing protein n=1 Tax=Devosia faecipullorum TaxID=2755039 RepID=UPI00187B3E2C|nr:DUF488 domain-containing protein [Devosia faecipullorum]
MSIRTIGHSNHAWPAFRRLLDLHGIGAIADVRSRPRSRLPHFTAPRFRANLNQVGVAYVFLGDQLGGMPAHGPHRYEDMAQTIAFRTGIARLIEIMPRTRLAICCSEHEVLECHRFLLISRHLTEHGVEVQHIHRDGSIETHLEAEQRLLARTRVQPDLLGTREDVLAEAYRRQEMRLRGEFA